MNTRKARLKYSFMLLLLSLSIGCSFAGNRFTYVADDLTDWQIKTIAHGFTSYEFKCGDSVYWIDPGEYYELRWLGPFLFPYVFPGFLFENHEKGPHDMYQIKFRLYTNKDNKDKSVTLTPLLALPDGNTMRPSACEEWFGDSSVDYKSAECKYDISFWDLPSFTLLIHSQQVNCLPTPLKLKKQTCAFYHPVAGGHWAPSIFSYTCK